MEYPKTQNLWARDDETHLMSPANGFRDESFNQVDKWLVLEKIDGMNIRVHYYPHGDLLTTDEPIVRINGRTDAAHIPMDLLASMKKTFTESALEDCFVQRALDLVQLDVQLEVVLFGEGFGAGIQKGNHYRPDKGFTLFDVVVDGRWLSWDGVVDVARRLGIETVPVLGQGLDTYNVQNLVSMMVLGKVPPTQWGCSTDTPEGIIARTDPYLFTGYGRRVMFKHKVRDVAQYLDTLKTEDEDSLAVSA